MYEDDDFMGAAFGDAGSSTGTEIGKALIAELPQLPTAIAAAVRGQMVPAAYAMTMKQPKGAGSRPSSSGGVLEWLKENWPYVAIPAAVGGVVLLRRKRSG